MSELSVKVREIRGALSGEEAAEKSGVSRETFYRIERGGTVKLDTLRTIGKAFALSGDDWVSLLIAWLRTEAGDEAKHLWIEPKEAGPSKLKDAGADQVAEAMVLFEQLNPNERHQILLTMKRKEVLACLPAINKVWEKFDTSAKK